MKLEDYPFKATMDARSALAHGLAELLRKIEFSMPRTAEPFKLEEVYASWATFRDRAMSSGGALPAAAVLPDRPRYSASQLTPAIIEGTWSGGDPNEVDDLCNPVFPIGDGTMDGHALFALSELEVDFVVLFRAKTEKQREAIVRRVEQVFVESGELVYAEDLDPRFGIPDEVEARHPDRYGKVVPLGDAYYGRDGRLTLVGQELLDSESSAAENRWMAQLEFTGQVRLCALRRVRGMDVVTRLAVNDVDQGSLEGV